MKCAPIASRCMHDAHVSLRDDSYYLINPGTIGEPRSAEHRATYMILDLERRTVTTRYVD